MGFETPFALLGLGLAALPVVIHLLRRRDLPERPLPTVALLRRAERRAARRVRLVDLLLLLARMALIAALVGGAAGPYVTVPKAFGGDGPGALVVVLDDSASMGRQLPAGGTAWDAALERARRWLDGLPPGSETALILAGDRPRVAADLGEGRDRVRRALTGLGDAPDARREDLPAALALARSELAKSRLEDQRILVLSDARRGGRPAAESPGAGEADEPPRSASLDSDRVIAPALLPVDAPTANLAVAQAVRVAGRSGSPDAVRVVIRRFGTGREPTAPRRVRLLTGNTVLAEDEVSFPSKEDVVRVTLRPEVPGGGELPPFATAVLGPAPIGQDALPVDDQRSLRLTPPPLPRLVLVDGEGGAEVNGAAFLRRAIDAAELPLQYELMDEPTFAATSLREIDLVALVAPRVDDAAALRRLRGHVDAGGGLLLWLGGDAPARRLAAVLGALLPAEPRSPVPFDPPAGLAVADADPLGIMVSGGLARTAVRRAHGLEGADPDEVAVWLQPPGGADASVTRPALVVRPSASGSGAVAVVAVGLSPRDSDLAFRPGFVPLVVRTLETLGVGRRATEDGALPGGRRVTIDLGRRGSQAEVVDPAGRRRSVAAGETFADTGAPGLYRVVDAGGSPVPAASFVVAPPLSESDLTTPSPPRASGEAGADDGSGAVAEARIPTGPWWFLAAGALLALEGLLRGFGRGNRPRSGSPARRP